GRMSWFFRPGVLGIEYKSLPESAGSSDLRPRGTETIHFAQGRRLRSFRQECREIEYKFLPESAELARCPPSWAASSPCTYEKIAMLFGLNLMDVVPASGVSRCWDAPP